MEHLLSLINVHHSSETAGLHVPSITQPQHRNPSWSLQSLSQNVNHYLSFIMTVRICLFESLHVNLIALSSPSGLNNQYWYWVTGMVRGMGAEHEGIWQSLAHDENITALSRSWVSHAAVCRFQDELLLQQEEYLWIRIIKVKTDRHLGSGL